MTEMVPGSSRQQLFLCYAHQAKIANDHRMFAPAGDIRGHFTHGFCDVVL